MTENSNRKIGRLYSKPLFYSILLSLIIGVISCFAIYTGVKLYDAQEKEVLSGKLEVVKSEINKVLKSANLEAFNVALQINASGNIENIDSIGALIISRNPSIIGIEIVPDGVITEVYPYERHKSAIGLDILNLPVAQNEALRAIKEKKVIYAGPIPLRQGGMAIIARLPIYRSGAFWGFSAILIDFESFLEEVGIKKSEFWMSFSKLDEKGKVVREWNPVQSSFKNTASIFINDANWKVTIYDSNSGNFYLFFLPIIVICLIFSISSGYLLYSTLRSPIVLKRKLDLKSRELLVRNSYFSSLINALPDLIFILDREGTILNFHSSNTEDLMDSPDNFIGKKVSEYFSKETSVKMISKVNYTIQKDIPTRITYSVNTKNSKEIYYEARIVKINESQALACVRNISSIVEANLKLQESETKYRQLVQQAPDCIFQTDKNGIILNVNQAGYQMTGYSSNDLINKHIDHCLQLTDDTISIVSYLKSSNIVSKYANLIGKDDVKIPVEVSASINTDGSILGITRDITERQEYIDYIEKKNAQLQEIAWIQSHEVRAPLAKIMSLIEFMRNHKDKGIFSDEEFFENLEKSTENLDAMIRDIVRRSEEAIKK